ncbi:MAG: hypothetical protein AAF845_15610 [Bacteroidota bacterium]
MNKIHAFALLGAFLTLGATVAFAQPPPPNAPAAIPVDGGLGLLALAGGAYAAKRLRARRADG